MITAPPSRRPVWTWAGSNWQRTDTIISADGRSITWGGRRVFGAVDITEKAGGAAYACRLDGVLTVFDFSGSHLCRRDLYLATRHL